MQRRRHAAARSIPRRVGFPQAPNPGLSPSTASAPNVSYTFDIFGGTRRELEGLAAEVDYQRYELESGAPDAGWRTSCTTAIRRAALRAQIESTEAILAPQAQAAGDRRATPSLPAASRRSTCAISERSCARDTRRRSPALRAQRAQAIHLLAIYARRRRRPRCRIPAAPPRPSSQLPATSCRCACPRSSSRQRPDIRAAEALSAQASADVGVATANLYPKLQISGALVVEPAERCPTSSATASTSGTSARNLLQPLFRGGELQARKRAAIAAYEQADAAYRLVGAAGHCRTSPTCCARSKPMRGPSRARSEQAARADGCLSDHARPASTRAA